MWLAAEIGGRQPADALSLGEGCLARGKQEHGAIPCAWWLFSRLPL
jgi:hypothetical protein